ncbi:uncharacterized protein C8orf88 homolog isoform X2 [Crotalus tigris]|uniref:uncharacterized protein C8orf88 homolog isoform X2 n=1 Tax=Crotalus tigris TaxID=88082 RepID=UPI00192F14FE|nr:uncharacterized protein C8orf88 homolog isoform X2 [Crotalus tigris]
METKRLIGKHLQPARSLCLSSRATLATVSTDSGSFQADFPCSASVFLHNEISSICKSNGMLVLNDNMIPSLSVQHKNEVTKGVSLAQKKPEFLPDHPIVLEKPKNYCLLPATSNDRSF